MRHKRVAKHFGRKPSARKSLVRGLVDSLVEHGQIRTTLCKAKELRRHVEKAVTKGKKGDLHARRVLLSSYPNEKTVKTLVDTISPRFQDRPGGYTRIIKLGHRPGDSAEMAYIQFVDYDASQKPEAAATSSKIEEKVTAQYRRRKRKLQREDRKIFRAHLK